MTTIEKETSQSPSPRNESVSKGRAILRPHIVAAVCSRDLSRSFTNVAGYVFIVLFIVASSVSAFWFDEFFAKNLANLGQLNEMMPFLLLLFIPAITMSVWAEERRQGTEELLLTLPARDLEVVLGKYLAALGVYTAAVGFLAIGLTGVLFWLGSPDLGILVATFIGYELMGAALLALGMVASLLSANITVAFILGSLFCAVPVFASVIGSGFATQSGSFLESISIPGQFRDFGRGVLSISGILYFLGLTAAMLYANVALVSRRHWAGGERSGSLWGHTLVRFVAVIVAVLSLQVLVARASWRPDLSAERLNTLSRESRELLGSISSDRTVLVEAFLSPEVPREYVETKENLLALLQSYDGLIGGKLRVNVVDTPRFSEEARRAEEIYGIVPRQVFTSEAARQGVDEIILGIAFTSGPEQVVIPFFDRGLPVEYELTRSIRTVAGATRKKIGVLDTDANMVAGFDFQRMSQSPDWQIVTELRKQYEVATTSPDTPIPSDLDALLVPQPSSLTQPQMNNLISYIESGGPALLFMDAMPAFDRSLSLAPTMQKQAPGGMFGGGQPPEQKADNQPLLDLLGIDWPETEVVWNTFNPHKRLRDLPREYVFIRPTSNNPRAFNPDDPITSGLQEAILLLAGHLKPRTGGGPVFTPLLRTDDLGGIKFFNEMISSNMLFGPQINPERARPFRSDDSYTMAARIGGPGESEEDQDRSSEEGTEQESDSSEPADRPIHAIVIMDLDFISDGLVQLREAGSDEFEFDNVTFLLNCVDELVGDDSFIQLRKQRRRHRTLTYLESFEQQYDAERLKEEQEAEDEATEELETAQAALDSAVQQIQSNDTIDSRTKALMVEQTRQREQLKLDGMTQEIEAKKERRIANSYAVKEQESDARRRDVKLIAAIVPPLPALMLGIAVFAVRSGRENRGASPGRLA